MIRGHAIKKNHHFVPKKMPAGYMAMEVAENKNEVEAATAKPDLLF